MNSLLRARKGTTLVEILVVMAVLLIGIMTIVMMFPAGFGVVKAAESQTIATKLAQAEVERWKNMPGNLPDGILPLAFDETWDGSSDTILNDQDPGPAFEGMLETSVPGRYYPGNAGNFRKVINEVTSIPIASYFQTGGGAIYGSRYNLAFSPIEVMADPDPSRTGLFLGISAKSGDLQRRRGDHDDRIYLRAGQYGVDYTLGKDQNGDDCFYVCFSYDRDPSHVYLITYSYTVIRSSGASTGPDTKYLTRVDEEVHPSATGDWVPVKITVPAGYEIEEVDEGTDSCARGFVQVASGWSADPYEFTVADPILGVIAFNPRARNALERTARGVRAVTARISYRIYDTRIIREERVVGLLNEDLDPNIEGNDHTAIKLALKFVLDVGDPMVIGDGDATDNPGEPTFEGLVYQRLGMQVTSPADVVVPQSLLVIDLATGLRVELPGGMPPGFDVRHYPIDYQAGIVHLPERANLIDWNSEVIEADVPLRGRHLRFFYRADGDWSMQCQKAYTYFIREYDDDIDISYQRFKLIQAADGTYRLLFAMCMAGQSVAVDYTYTDASGTHRVSGRNLRLSDDWIAGPGGRHCSYVTLGGSGISIDPNDRIIVVGTSFRSRVIWRDGKTWRHVDIDTNLTRNSVP